MKLIDNLNEINTYKEDIKSALELKGVNMTNVAFSDYAGKIRELQFESGDAPSTPTPSADYIYTNGYLKGSDPITIVDNIPLEIYLDENGKFIIDIICPVEIKGSASKNIYDTILTIDIPSSYKMYVEYYDQGTTSYYEQEMKPNPRHDKISRNNIEYYSWVRAMEDGKDQGSAYVSSEELQYRITIEKK
jgi:hypothetical protein